LRVLAWPVTGLVTSAPVAAIIAAAAVIGSIVWRASAGDEPERRAARWFGLSLIWTTLALAVAASGLATVIPRPPNDHYHAFADPIVFVAIGLGTAGLIRAGQKREATRATPVAYLAAPAIVIAIAGFNLVRQPPATSPDGGWPAGDAASVRVLEDLGGEPSPGPTVALESLPTFKSADALGFPLTRRGVTIDAATAAPEPIVVLCDGLFVEAIGAPCGGSAEDALVAGRAVSLADRFESAPDRWVSVYVPNGEP